MIANKFASLGGRHGSQGRKFALRSGAMLINNDDEKRLFLTNSRKILDKIYQTHHKKKLQIFFALEMFDRCDVTLECLAKRCIQRMLLHWNFLFDRYLFTLCVAIYKIDGISNQTNAHNYRHGVKPAVAMIINNFTFKFLNIKNTISVRMGG